MSRRHEALKRVYSALLTNTESIRTLFDFEKTTHADLDLSWIKPDFQEKHIGPTTDYQVIIATVKPGQVSDAHMHEIGASAFVVLGPKTGCPTPVNLTYRTGKLAFPSGSVEITEEVICAEGLEIDIPSYQVHQFENKSNEPALILIVTHPIISVEEGNEDIHFVMNKK